MVFGVIAAVFVSCITLFFALARSDVFMIETIDVNGVEHLTEDEVRALIEIDVGATLLNVDTDSIIASLMRDSWIESVSIRRVFPSTLQINITERQIRVIVEIPIGRMQATEDWALAQDNIWLMSIPDRDSEIGQRLSGKIYEDAESVIHITDIPFGVTPEIGEECTDENIINALTILSGMTTSLKDEVKSISAPDIDSTTLILDNNIEITFGSAEYIREKELICQNIMGEVENVISINVRSPQRPTYRHA